MKIELPMRGETKVLSPEARASLPGEFIQLTDGFVHYELSGPENGPVVILIHGFSVPFFIWDPTFEVLSRSGYRVLRYDLFGRGYSDRPHVSYDKDLFDRQLVGLLDELGIERCLAVIGLSMGGVIASNFAVRYPDRVDKLILVDPAGFPLKVPLIVNLLLVPPLGELLFGLVSGKTLERVVGDVFYDPNHVHSFAQMYRPSMQYKGFRRALISTIREGVVRDSLDVYRKLGQMDTPPVLLFWGEQDMTVPFKFSTVFISLVPRTKFFPIRASGHIPHYEHASQVNPVLLEFLHET
jgi:pimeloyl-ACP methyl ester carboxylesterase